MWNQEGLPVILPKPVILHLFPSVPFLLLPPKESSPETFGVAVSPFHGLWERKESSSRWEGLSPSSPTLSFPLVLQLLQTWLSLPGFVNMVVTSAMYMKVLWNTGACGLQTQDGYSVQGARVAMCICFQADFKIRNHRLEWLTVTRLFNFFFLTCAFHRPCLLSAMKIFGIYTLNSIGHFACWFKTC